MVKKKKKNYNYIATKLLSSSVYLEMVRYSSCISNSQELFSNVCMYIYIICVGAAVWENI